MRDPDNIFDDGLVTEIISEISMATNKYVARGDELVDAAVVMALLTLGLDGAREVFGRVARDRIVDAYVAEENLEDMLAELETKTR